MTIGAFIDESGTHSGSPISTMGAYLFRDRQYRRFIDEWALALSERGSGIRFFHAKECAHLRGEFQRVGLGRTSADALYQYLIALIKRRAILGVAVSAAESDFEAAKPPWVTHSFYSYLVQCLTGGIYDWAERSNFAGGISYILEAGHEKEGEAGRGLEVLRDFPVCRTGSRYVSHAFGSKDGFPGLQAADILAYEWFKDRKNQMEGEPRRRRQSLAALMKGKAHVHAHFTREMMTNTFRQIKSVKRGVMDGSIDLGVRFKGWKGPDPEDYDD